MSQFSLGATAEGVVPRDPMLTPQEWDAIVAHDTAAGTVRGQGDYATLVDMSYAERAIAALVNKG